MVKGLEQLFFQRQRKNGQQVHENVPLITSHQGNAIKTTMRQHFTPTKLVIIKKTTEKKCWQGCVEKGTLCTVGMNVKWYSHHQKSMEFSQRNKNRTTVRSNNSTYQCISKGIEITNLKRYLHAHVHFSLIHKARTWKQSNWTPMDKQVKKM